MSSVSVSAGDRSAPFRADIQGLRGIAVLLVVWFHIDGLLPGGFVGVDVFFVISGFLIGRLLLDELAFSGRLRLGHFFRRRIRRLLPALAVTTASTVVLAGLLVPIGPRLQSVVSTAVAATVSLANLELLQATGYFAPAADLNPLLHTWSLSVEEQFYLLLPVSLVAVATVGRRLRHGGFLTGAVWLAVLSSLALNVWLTRRGAVGPWSFSGQQLAFYLPVTRAWEFGVGVLLAHHGRAVHLGRYSSVVVGAVGLGLVALASVLYTASTPFPGFAAAAPVVGTALVIAAGQQAGPLSGSLGHPALTWIGDRSYSWYLWHWPAIVFARSVWPASTLAVLLAAFASLVPASLSYRFVEQRFRRDARFLGARRTLALASACLAVPVVAATAMGLGNRVAIDNLSRVAEGARSAFEEADAGPATWQPPACPTGRDCGPRSVVLVGDSHAGALAAGAAPVLRDAGYRFGLLSRNGCAFLEGVATDPGCDGWQREVMASLTSEPPSVVVIHGYTTGRVTTTNSGETNDYDIVDADGRRPESDDEALLLYRDGLRGVVDGLQRAGIPVVIVSTVPDFGEAPFADVSLWTSLRGVEVATGDAVPRWEAAERNARILEVERRIAEEADDVVVIDALPLLCRASCSQVAGGSLLYRDHDHLAPPGAGRVARAILEAVRSLEPPEVEAASGGRRREVSE